MNLLWWHVEKKKEKEKNEYMVTGLSEGRLA